MGVVPVGHLWLKPKLAGQKNREVRRQPQHFRLQPALITTGCAL